MDSPTPPGSPRRRTRLAPPSAIPDLLDQVAPPEKIPGLPAGEKWHPLLGAQAEGNLYLSVRDDGTNVDIGIAGELRGGVKPKASLRAHLPIIRFTGAGMTAI